MNSHEKRMKRWFEKNERIIIVGESGSGKTTLVRNAVKDAELIEVACSDLSKLTIVNLIRASQTRTLTGVKKAFLVEDVDKVSNAIQKQICILVEKSKYPVALTTRYETKVEDNLKKMCGMLRLGGLTSENAEIDAFLRGEIRRVNVVPERLLGKALEKGVEPELIAKADVLLGMGKKLDEYRFWRYAYELCRSVMI